MHNCNHYQEYSLLQMYPFSHHILQLDSDCMRLKLGREQLMKLSSLQVMLVIT